MFRRQHLLVSLSVALFSLVIAGGCSENTQATPRVTFESSIAKGKHSSTECTQSGPWFGIGSFGNPGRGEKPSDDPDNHDLVDPLRPVDDGGEDGQGTASVSCSVVEATDGFDVILSAQLSGATGGAMTLSGHILRNIDSPGVTMRISRKGETYSANANCTMTFNTGIGHGIAAGRVWGIVDCPDAEAPGQQRICATNAILRFENCGQ